MDYLKKLFYPTADLEPEVTILRPAEAKIYPEDGDLVEVVYHGYLTNGALFEDSRQRGKPLRFQVGSSKTIECWQKAIKKIALNERAKIFCDRGLAYGSKGIPGKIPKNSDLIFYFELVGILRGKDRRVKD